MTSIRVVLPVHLRNLARTGKEVTVSVPGDGVTQRAVLDALELAYPVLLGTIRDRQTGKRRAFVRFYACEQDLSNDPPDAPLPAAVTAALAAGAFRSDDAGETWRPVNRGLHSEGIPDPGAEVGHCVHRLAMHPSRPSVLYMQKHWDVMRSDDAGESWREVSGDLPTDFGFPIDVHAHEPETVYVVPITSDSHHFPPEGKLRVYRSRTGGNDWEALTRGLPQEHCYVNVLRDAMAIDSLEDCGVYFGTTGGQVYASADAGDSWAPIARDLPAVLSVEVQTLP